jgi:hypothetical protein
MQNLQNHLLSKDRILIGLAEALLTAHKLGLPVDQESPEDLKAALALKKAGLIGGKN